MIESLRIRGLGVIDDAVIKFGSGLTAITGETGAGKTMVLTGLSLLAGGKADVQVVRHGSERAEVDGEWSLAESNSGKVLDRLRDAGAQIDIAGGKRRYCWHGPWPGKGAAGHLRVDALSR